MPDGRKGLLIAMENLEQLMNKLKPSAYLHPEKDTFCCDEGCVVVVVGRSYNSAYSDTIFRQQCVEMQARSFASEINSRFVTCVECNMPWRS